MRGIETLQIIENEVYFQQKRLNVCFGWKTEGGRTVKYDKYYNFRTTLGEHISIRPEQFAKDQVMIGNFWYRKTQRTVPQESEQYKGHKYWIYDRMDKAQVSANFNPENFKDVFKEEINE